MYERVVRFGAPAAVALLAVVGAFFDEPRTTSLVAAGVVVAVCAGLAVRPLQGRALPPVLVVLAVLVAVDCQGAENIGWFAVCVLAGWAGSLQPVRLAVPLVAAAVGLFVVEALVIGPEDGWGAWMTGTAISGAAGIVGRRQRDLVEQLRAAQGGLEDRARVEERNRIAHELHDVIGHALTVSLLHVTSARLSLAEDPAEAQASLAEAERLSQQSLAEVRAVVGLMRDADSSSPLPGATELDALVESFRRAGAEVDWRVEGDRLSLTATEGLTVYRILQESLTNVVRHAPGSPVSARVVVAAGATTVLVDSAGAPALTAREGGGVSGMRARAEALGGRLTAGPAGGGWRVEAVLPS